MARRKRRNRKKNNNQKKTSYNRDKNPKKNKKEEITFKMRQVIEQIDSKHEFSEISVVKITNDNGLAYETAEAFIAEEVNYTQVRNLYAHVKKIERNCKDWDSIKAELFLLKPRLASKYAQKNISKGFYDLMMLCIERINAGTNQKENFNRFVYYFESTVAFHKYLGEINNV